MPAGLVPGCPNEGTCGENWRPPEDEGVSSPIVWCRYGLGLELSVPDLANRLVLCDDHAGQLMDAAWRPLLTLLRDWGWTTSYGNPPDPDFIPFNRRPASN